MKDKEWTRKEMIARKTAAGSGSFAFDRYVWKKAPRRVRRALRVQAPIVPPLQEVTLTFSDGGLAFAGNGCISLRPAFSVPTAGAVSIAVIFPSSSVP